MNAHRAFIGLVVTLALLLGVGAVIAQEPEPEGNQELLASAGTGFTYQGRLLVSGRPANGAYDMTFSLYDAESGGSQVGSTITADDCVVEDGLFTTSLDFGAQFDGNARWLEIGVRSGDSEDSFTTLEPRQQLRPAPYAVSAMGLSLPISQTVSTSGGALRVENDGGIGLYGASACAEEGACSGVLGYAADGFGVLGITEDGSAVVG